MKFLFLFLICLVLTTPALAIDPPRDTGEFEVTVSGSLEVPLTSVFQHFLLIADADMEVRFVLPTYNADGTVASFIARPYGDPTVPAGTGPRPDISDTTLTVFSALAENIYNDMPAKKLNLTGTGTVTIKAKK